MTDNLIDGRTIDRWMMKPTEPSSMRILAIDKFPKHPPGCCRWCGVQVEKPRRTFCSEECVLEWTSRRSPGVLRNRVWSRDHGLCALCGNHDQTELATLQEIRGFIAQEVYLRKSEKHKSILRKLYHEIDHYIFSKHREWRRWEMDHTVPIIEGGDPFEMSNLRTLCIDCHKAETKALAARRAKRRRDDKPVRQLMML